MNLNELRDEAYRIACEHGWHDTELSDEHCLMLIVCELAEAVEADRKNRHADRTAFESETMHALREMQLSGTAYNTYECSAFNTHIKDTLEDEFADVVIRCLDFAGLRGIDLKSIDELEDLDYQFESPEIMKDFAFGSFTEVMFELSEMVLSCSVCTGELHHIRFRRFLCYILYYCKENDIELEWHIKQKMHYNEYRAYKHGKKY